MTRQPSTRARGVGEVVRQHLVLVEPGDGDPPAVVRDVGEVADGGVDDRAGGVDGLGGGGDGLTHGPGGYRGVVGGLFVQ